MSQTWCESGSESGKSEGRMKKVGGYLRTKGNFFDFGCGFTYVVYQSPIPFHPHSSPSASWSTVPMVTVCDGFWMWWHHQVWLSLGKVIKTYYLWSNSHPVPFWVFLHLFLSSKEGGLSEVGCSSRWDFVPQKSCFSEVLRLRPRKQIHFSWNFHREQCFWASALMML